MSELVAGDIVMKETMAPIPPEATSNVCESSFTLMDSFRKYVKCIVGLTLLD